MDTATTPLTTVLALEQQLREVLERVLLEDAPRLGYNLPQIRTVLRDSINRVISIHDMFSGEDIEVRRSGSRIDVTLPERQIVLSEDGYGRIPSICGVCFDTNVSITPQMGVLSESLDTRRFLHSHDDPVDASSRFSMSNGGDVTYHGNTPRYVQLNGVTTLCGPSHIQVNPSRQLLEGVRIEEASNTTAPVGNDLGRRVYMFVKAMIREKFSPIRLQDNLPMLCTHMLERQRECIQAGYLPTEPPRILSSRVVRHNSTARLPYVLGWSEAFTDWCDHTGNSSILSILDARGEIPEEIKNLYER